MNDNNRKKNSSSCLPVGMCIGIAVGTAVGAATHNIGLWMPVGLAVGTGLGLVLGHSGEDGSEDDTDDRR